MDILNILLWDWLLLKSSGECWLLFCLIRHWLGWVQIEVSIWTSLSRGITSVQFYSLCCTFIFVENLDTLSIIKGYFPSFSGWKEGVLQEFSLCTTHSFSWMGLLSGLRSERGKRKNNKDCPFNLYTIGSSFIVSLFKEWVFTQGLMSLC